MDPRRGPWRGGRAASREPRRPRAASARSPRCRDAAAPRAVSAPPDGVPAPRRSPRTPRRNPTRRPDRSSPTKPAPTAARRRPDPPRDVCATLRTRRRRRHRRERRRPTRAPPRPGGRARSATSRPRTVSRPIRASAPAAMNRPDDRPTMRRGPPARDVRGAQGPPSPPSPRRRRGRPRSAPSGRRR